MNYSWTAIVRNAARALSDVAGVPVDEKELVPPPDSKLGDLSFGCFKIAKMQGKNPAELAKEIAEKIVAKDQLIESAVATGPYVNITLRGGDVINRIIQDVEHLKSEYGRMDVGGNKQVMVEYAQPNTHKEIHVGHLRNLVLGTSVARVLLANGWNVITASYHGDVGAHVAKCLWLFVRKGALNIKQVAPKRKKNDPEFVPLEGEAWVHHVLTHLTEAWAEEILEAIPANEKTGKSLGALYSESTKLLEENPDWKTEVSEVQQKLEAREPAWNKIWQETRRWSLDEMGHIFEDLGVMIDRQYLESEVVDEGQRMVDELLKKGVAKESQGAIVVDLEDQKLGVFLVRKSDGTSLYATKDLALAKLKFKEYPKLERSLMVVDSRQSFYFKQLFATLKLMGFEKPMEFVGYEFVTLKSGAMSSREGNIVTWQSFRDEVLAYATKETQTRHPEWNEGKVTHTAWCLMMGGIKFGMLKQDSDKIFVFDLEQALSFDGATGPYVQYAATRLGSILRKAEWKAETGLNMGDPSILNEAAEKRLALWMAQFPQTVEKAGEELRPAIIAQWCLEMATRVNEFYRDVKVIDADKKMQEARLRLVASARTVLLLGLHLLGIPVPEEM